jgi:hypothetical protein
MIGLMLFTLTVNAHAQPTAYTAEQAADRYGLCLWGQERTLYKLNIAGRPAFPLLALSNAEVVPTLVTKCAAEHARILAAAIDPAGAQVAMIAATERESTRILEKSEKARPKLMELAARIDVPGPRGPVLVIYPRFDQADYPMSSLRDGDQGAADAAFTVGIDGRATGCSASGASAALNATACKIIMARAVYAPAIDATGARLAAPAALKLTFKID